MKKPTAEQRMRRLERIVAGALEGYVYDPSQGKSKMDYCTGCLQMRGDGHVRGCWVPLLEALQKELAQ